GDPGSEGTRSERHSHRSSRHGDERRRQAPGAEGRLRRSLRRPRGRHERARDAAGATGRATATGGRRRVGSGVTSMAEPISSLLQQTRRDFSTTLAIAGAITLFVNLGALFVPLYDIQLYDRVMQSHSMETLAVLGIACIFGTAMYGILE